MDLAYLGSGFSGWAENADIRSVEQTLREALEELVRHPVTLDVAGRTDKGVHADGQVVSLTTSSDIAADRLAIALNGRLNPEIAVGGVADVDPDFHARFSAVGRRYRYRIVNRPVLDPQRAAVAWHVRHPLDLDAMNAAAGAFVGEHDFTSFCRRPEQPPDASLVRAVREAAWRTVDDELHLHIEANAFCHQMVRALTGFMAEVGRGRRSADEVAPLLAARDRAAVRADLAPPHGLTLVAVRYPDEPG